MFSSILLLTLTALVLWGLWSVARPRAVFVVQIVQGEARVSRGTVTPAFVQEVREVCVHNKVEDGEVRGVARDDRIALEFSAQHVRALPPTTPKPLDDFGLERGETPKELSLTGECAMTIRTTSPTGTISTSARSATSGARRTHGKSTMPIEHGTTPSTADRSNEEGHTTEVFPVDASRTPVGPGAG